MEVRNDIFRGLSRETWQAYEAACTRTRTCACGIWGGVLRQAGALN